MLQFPFPISCWSIQSSSSFSSSSSSSCFLLFHHSLKVSSLTDDQLECLCLALENFDNFRGLELLLNLIPPTFFEKSSSKSVLLRAKALLLFYEGRYEEFKEYIRLNQFKQKDHNLLQNLWNEANYLEASKQRNKPLDAVSRYRIRKKNIFPSSIWDGEGTSYCFKKKAREILKQSYKIDSVPDMQRKQELAKQTELSVLQVSNWFKNQRQRARQNKREIKQLKNKEILEECNCCNNTSDYAESEGRQSVADKQKANKKLHHFCVKKRRDNANIWTSPFENNNNNNKDD
uniref:Homeobox domain-containing protein n=1 Tax=Meloidogyne hapla TaxID=6305 RepID=A0A1I8B7U9_MELHA